MLLKQMPFAMSVDTIIKVGYKLKPIQVYYHRELGESSLLTFFIGFRKGELDVLS